MPRTVLRSATKSPVRYSAKWRRWQSWAKWSPYRARASWTSLGNSMIPGMIVCPAVQLRQSGSGAERGGFTYFNAPPWQITKSQREPEGDGLGHRHRRGDPGKGLRRDEPHRIGGRLLQQAPGQDGLGRA